MAAAFLFDAMAGCDDLGFYCPVLRKSVLVLYDALDEGWPSRWIKGGANVNSNRAKQEAEASSAANCVSGASNCRSERVLRLTCALLDVNLDVE